MLEAIGVSKGTQLALAGTSAIAVSYGFARYGYGLFVPAFREEFGLSTGTIGFISSSGYAAYLLAMALTGFLTYKIGPRLPVVTGIVCASMGMALISTAQSPLMLTAGVVLAGSSAGFCWAPFSDAVAILVEKEHRNRVLSVISTGTTFGLTVAGPVALLASTSSVDGGSGWRYAWAAFAGVALFVALWNFRLLPLKPYHGATKKNNWGDDAVGMPSFGWFLSRRTVPLLGQAFFYGLVAAFYYTYAVDLVRRSGFGEAWGPILWGLVGVAGVTGVFSGDAVLRFGLKRYLTICLGMLAVSIGALGLTQGSGALVVACAIAFGASYMPIAALLVIWSGSVFHEKPATGFSAVLFSLALGSILGPAMLGAVAEVFDLRVAFWCAAALTALSIMLRPTSDIHNTMYETS